MATTMAKSPESFMFTVGKLDAGMAILLGERAHLIEFPSILLPPGATAGSIVNISVHRNLAEEKKRDVEFWDLQREIYETYGVDTPRAPKVEVRNVTQTSVTLEWPSLHLATAKLRSLDIYRNGQRLAAIPQPLHNTSTKLSGLDINSEYSFQLVLRTTAGNFPSNVVRVRTHTMTDTSGISVCFGTVQDATFLEEAKLALGEMRAKWSDKIQIDTTHFVCTTPAAGTSSGPGVEYQRALQLSIPVVTPQWVLACHRERKMVPIAQFYLGASSNNPISSAPFTRPQSMSQVSLQRAQAGGQQAQAATSNHRMSMPPQRRATNGSPPGADSHEEFVNQSPQSPTPKSKSSAAAAGRVRSPDRSTSNVPQHASLPDVSEEAEGGDSGHDSPSPTSPSGARRVSTSRRQRNGTMDKNFKFPSPQQTSAPPPPLPDSAHTQAAQARVQAQAHEPTDVDAAVDVPLSPVSVPTPEVPPPDPVEKGPVERNESAEVDEDIGATEEISLN